MIKIGFWAELPPNHPASTDEGLPWPFEFFSPQWDNNERLKVAEYLDSGKIINAYKGCSTCRLCGISNGSTELSDGKYLWPEGYSHYIREHKIKPPQDFIEWVLSPANDKIKNTKTNSEENLKALNDFFLRVMLI